jgi:tetratricopeptide (TPR) repeat protein
MADDAHLSARVGIASGQVVIGDLVGDAGRDVDAVTGETPNLAARLQGLARPNQVVIDASTRGLVGNAFELDGLGSHDLKGFSQPVPVWRVVGEGKAESRFEAAHAGRLAPFIGRTQELGLLRKGWTLAKGAQGQVVLLTGEAGIGKSRMVEALCDAIGEERHFRLRYQCSPYHTSSAFYPVIQHLKRAAGFTDDDDAVSRLDKLEALLRQASNDIDAEAPLFAALLSLPCEHRYGNLNLSPQQQRERTIEALIKQLTDLSKQRPILFVLEDAHWIDPTTEALVGEAMSRIANVPVLIVITYRPDYTPSWPGLPNGATISLNRLSREQGAEMVRAMGGDELAAKVIAEIIARAGGVPLYVEELTKSLLESSGHEAEVPASLQASLVARLDRLGDADKVAQLAATLGRSFHYRFIEAVVRAVGAVDESVLNPALAAMLGAGLLLEHGTPPQATYTFKHALIQDAAYATLLRGKRQEYHNKVAEVLLRDFIDEVATEPEVVARHLSLAGDPERSAEFWLLAGQRAGKRSAHMEAVANLESGFRELKLLPKSRSRDEQEFAFRVSLGASLLALKGWSAQEVEANYERTQELSALIGDTRKSFTALRGLFNVYLLRGEVSRARQLADRLLEIALEVGDGALLLEGYRTVGMCAFFVGDLEAADEHLQRGNAIYDRSVHHAHAFVYGTDPAVVGLSVGGWVRWFLGDPKRARNDVDAALSLAEELRHPFSLAYAESLAASLYQVCRNPEAVREHADKAIAIAEVHDFPYWVGWASVMRGWSLAALGSPEQGMDVLQQGLETYESTGALQIKPYILTLLAEMHGWAGLPQKGIAVLEGAHGPGNELDVRFYEAEALRIHGELLRQLGAGDGQEYFERALDLARRQRARSLELRIAVSAGRAALERGEKEAADALVSAVYRSFDAGLDDPDLSDARTLLARSAAL